MIKDGKLAAPASATFASPDLSKPNTALCLRKGGGSMLCSISREHIEPAEGVFDFNRDEAIVNVALGNAMAVKSCAGGWHLQLPSWLLKKTFAELGPLLLKFIDTVGRHYAGKIAEWHVFNEIVNDDGDGFRNRQADATKYAGWMGMIPPS